MSTSTTTPPTQRPKVLIIGAGLGGLILGALLQKTNVPYTIYEGSPVHNPIGSILALGPAVMPLFKQLGVYEELRRLSFVMGHNRTYNAKGELIIDLDFKTGSEERFAFNSCTIARPVLYNLLIAQIPKENLLYSKKLVSFEETSTKVLVRFTDHSTAEGQILVGADGANSAVRQNLYKKVEKLGTLPPGDKLPLQYSSIALVGQTRALDREKYGFLMDVPQEEGLCDAVLADKDTYGAGAYLTAQNTICWMIVEYLDQSSSKLLGNYRSSEWGPEAAEEMSSRPVVRDFVFPRARGMTMGEIIDMTPKELMSKVMLEEKLFETWNEGRTVLLGDACHKMAPAAGQGAVNAMLDALVLANYIETLHNNDLTEITTAFKAYKEERFDLAKSALDASATTTLMNKNGWAGEMFRMLIWYAPEWLKAMTMVKMAGYRPQAAFLPAFEDKGSVKPAYQASLYLEKSRRADVCV